MRVLTFIFFTSLTFSFTLARSKTRYNPIGHNLVVLTKDELFGNGAKCKERWEAEGASIKSALTNIFTRSDLGVTLNPSIDTHLVVGSAGGNTGTLIAGLIQILDALQLKCSRIVVVYTLNYTSEEDLTSDDYLTFKALLDKLLKYASDTLRIEAYRLEPKIFVQTDYTHTDEPYMEKSKIEPQQQKIKNMNDADKITGDTMDENDLYWLMQDPNVTMLLDGIVGSGSKVVTDKNQHLIAISKAQIRVMSRATRIRQGSVGNILVIVNDAPSGMSEDGKWVCGGGYDVNFILSSGWNKPLVNELRAMYKTVVIVLDISYKGSRFVDVLLTKIGKDDIPLRANIKDAIDIRVGHGFFKFRKAVTHNYYVPIV